MRCVSGYGLGTRCRERLGPVAAASLLGNRSFLLVVAAFCRLHLVVDVVRIRRKPSVVAPTFILIRSSFLWQTRSGKETAQNCKILESLRRCVCEGVQGDHEFWTLVSTRNFEGASAYSRGGREHFFIDFSSC